MKIARCFKAGSFILGVALLAGLSVATQAGAQQRGFLLDTNSRELIDLGIRAVTALLLAHYPRFDSRSMTMGR
jgi:hypothetical protein